MTITAPPGDGLRARQARLAREAAVTATIALLEAAETSGTDSVTMPAVARAAGISLRTLYRHFPTRDALLHEAGAHVQSQLALPIDIEDPADIPSTFWAASDRMAQHPQLARALARSVAGRTAHAATRAARVGALQRALARLTAGLPEAQARQVTGVITHLCSSTAWVGVADESGLPDAEARAGVRWALSVLLDAVGAEAAESTPAQRQGGTA
jgi:AcrR family transcriptional regulator